MSLAMPPWKQTHTKFHEWSLKHLVNCLHKKHIPCHPACKQLIIHFLIKSKLLFLNYVSENVNTTQTDKIRFFEVQEK